MSVQFQFQIETDVVFMKNGVCGPLENFLLFCRNIVTYMRYGTYKINFSINIA